MSETIHQNTQKNPNFSTQLYLRIAEIHNDTVVLKNGGLRAIVEVDPVNVNLKSEEEQKALAYSYQGFLNSLEFPIQIVVRSKKLEIANYLGKLRQAGKKQTNELLKNQIAQYIEYLRRLVEFADIMEKHFYVIIPLNPLRAQKSTILEKFWDYVNPADSVAAFTKRQKEFAELNKKLQQRTEQIINGLENCNLRVQRLNTADLIQLFYEIYNPLTARNEKIKNFKELDLTENQET